MNPYTTTDAAPRNVFGQPRRVEVSRQTMPEGSAARKNVPLCTGVLDYFPAALAAVARLSKYGNDKHNPGEALHWARGKSMDHADCIARHLVDRGIIDPDTGLSHTVEVAWRALALLQEELEAAGAPLSRGSKVVSSGSPLTPRQALSIAEDAASTQE